MAFVNISTRLKNTIQTFNLFEDIEHQEEQHLKNQRASTRVFLILLFISIVSILVYASLASVTKTVVVQQPSITVYNDLQSKYPNTLVCPCQEVLNTYSTFMISFTPKFNQICSSDFVSDQWLNYVNYRLLTQSEYHYVYDFRHSAYSFFQMLRTLCTLVSQTIDDQLIQFYSTTLLTENVVSEETFLVTTVATKYQFLNATASSFQVSLNLLRTIIQADNIANRIQTNNDIWTMEHVSNGDMTTNNVEYPPDKCSCAVSSYCNTTTGIFTLVRKHHSMYEPSTDPYIHPLAPFRIHLVFYVPGINVGCFILDAVLQSNLSCLYNMSCLSQLNMYLNNSLPSFNATALNITYSALPTVGDLVDNLMVDEWLFNASYESYFSQCNPLTCTYTYVKQFDVLFIITTVMGTIGGIVTILMLVTLRLVSFIRRYVCRQQRSLVAQAETDTGNSISLRRHFQSLPSKIKNFLINLNLFKDPDEQNIHDLKNQRISTRLFIVSMIVALSVLVLYTSLAIVTQTVTIKQPTVNIYTELQTKYSQTLICPCTQIEIEYKEFISFHPTFHQICSSDFITTKWINYFLLKQNEVADIYDLRIIAPLYFSSLSAFCNLSVETINNALFLFNSTTYVTKNVQKTDLFGSQTRQITNLFEKTTINSYLQALSMGRQMITGNALFSLITPGYGFTLLNDGSYDEIFYPFGMKSSNDSTGCSCKLEPTTCGRQIGIDSLSVSNATLIFSVPGLWYGCYTIESLYQSTLECYFNQSCLNRIYQLIALTVKYPFNATAMVYNSSNTQYSITTKIQNIIEQLMIEQWNEQISFNLYYNQCGPVFCIYTYNKQGDLAYMFTTIIGLIGGLTTILKIIILPIVTFLRRKKRPQTIETEVNEHEHAPNFFRKYIQILKSYVITLNLFKNVNRRSNEQIQYQRISTRLFIILLTVSLIVLFVYVSLENVTQTVTVKNPSINQFNLLYQQYSDSLQCPCKTLSIEYQDFIRFDPQLHAVCGSDFVTSKTWLELDYPIWKFDEHGIPTFRTHIDDFRQIASLLFQLLFSFCQLSLQTLNIELPTFNFTTYITPNLVSQQRFKTQISQIISQFVENTARSFISNLRLINNMTSANMLISALASDSLLTVYPQYYAQYGDYVYEYIYDRKDQIYNSSLTGTDCDCQENPYCIQQAIVYGLDATTMLFSIPGIYVGCYLDIALLQSDLRCFYNDSCLQKLINSLQLSINISSLSNSASIYEMNATLQEIVSNLMVEQWNFQDTYQDYFNQCQPDECSATYVRSGNILYIITSMTGLIGGLTKVYLFAVPLLVKIVFLLIVRLKRKTTVNITVVPLETTASEANV